MKEGNLFLSRIKEVHLAPSRGKKGKRLIIGETISTRSRGAHAPGSRGTFAKLLRLIYLFLLVMLH